MAKNLGSFHGRGGDVGGRDSGPGVLDFGVSDFPHFRSPDLDDRHPILDRQVVLNRNLKT